MMDGSSEKVAPALVIPSRWSERYFYDLAKITSGQVDPRKTPYYSMILVAPDHIRTGSGRIDQRLTAIQQGAISGKYLVQKGEVIYSKIRPNLQKLALADEDCLCSADMYPVAAKEGVSALFLKYLMLSARFTNFATSVSVRSGMPKINRQELAHFSAVVPDSYEEQEAIGEALSDADALIEGLERLIAKKRLIKQGAMQDLLTGKRRLPGFSGEWVTDKIGNLARITTGSRDTKDREANGTYPFFVRSQTVERINSVGFDGEGVLTAGDGVGTGKIFHYINGKCDFHQRVYLMRAFDDSLSARYFYHYFSNFFYERIMSMTAKSSVDSVRREMIFDMEIRLPPTTDEQVQITTILDDMDAEIQALETRLEKARSVKEGMMQNLLSGRIRLV